ncbi:hypothetical protein B0H63DRAFT_559559 [Podospora didyma]|uniref:Uncharacterized protein n=1 Tax=Podospora didyma TaxID=330526 RepID=A0AAE0TZ24_9PEZI|nr:hypothetical protein B0H63DRAFT_559559 [Podospora didyma]
MWLIDTAIMRLREVTNPEPRSYAILSHTWAESGEVTFQNITNPDPEAALTKPGFAKIVQIYRAYSLFGIFDIHLPLIYGEGEKSFIRLQEAIAQDSADLSLFAWTSKQEQMYRGVFAISPDEFADCGKIHRVISPLVLPMKFSLTNKGIEIPAGLYSVTRGEDHDYLMDLQCVDMTRQQIDGAYGAVCVRLVKCAHNYVRHSFGNAVAPPVAQLNKEKTVPGLIHIPKLIRKVDSEALEVCLFARFQLELINETPHDITFPFKHRYLLDPVPKPMHLWNPENNPSITDRHRDFSASIKFHIAGGTFQNDGGNAQPQNWIWRADDIDIGIGLREESNRRRATMSAIPQILELQLWAKIRTHGQAVAITPFVNDLGGDDFTWPGKE